MENFSKKQFFLLNIIFCLFSMNLIKADVNLMNGITYTKKNDDQLKNTVYTIKIYPSTESILKANPKLIETGKQTALEFPTSENYFIIKLADGLFFQFFYTDLEDKETFIIFFGINNDNNKYSCTLINTNSHQEKHLVGIRTILSLEQLKINFLQYSKKHEKKNTADLSQSSEEEINKIKNALQDFLMEETIA